MNKRAREKNIIMNDKRKWLPFIWLENRKQPFSWTSTIIPVQYLKNIRNDYSFRYGLARSQRDWSLSNRFYSTGATNSFNNKSTNKNVKWCVDGYDNNLTQASGYPSRTQHHPTTTHSWRSNFYRIMFRRSFLQKISLYSHRASNQ